MAAASSEPLWARFREYVFARLNELCGCDAFGYIDAEHATHTCPVCRSGHGEYLAIEWHGETARVRVWCSRGCPLADIAHALKLDVSEHGGRELLVTRQTLLPPGWFREEPRVKVEEWRL